MRKLFFELDLAYWLLIIFAIVAIFLTFFYYRNTNPELTRIQKLILSTIRSLALILLIFVFAKPILTFISFDFNKPKIAFLVDNSQSMNFKYGNVDKKEQLLLAIRNFQNTYNNKYPVEFYIFDADSKASPNFSPEMLNFSGQSTNISSAFEKIRKDLSNHNFQAVIIATDGIYNEGDNPIFASEKLLMPIYTISIGDTTQPKDVSIERIITNDPASVGKTQPVKVNIKSVGYNNEVTIKLFEEQNLIGEKNIILDPKVQEYSVLFDYEPKEVGFRKLTAQVSTLPDEFTNINNQLSEVVKVVDNRSKFLILAGYPNPDIPFIRNIIENESGNPVVTFTQKKGAEFYNPQPNRRDFENAEIFVLIGFPISQSPDHILQWLREELSKGKSILFIPQLLTDYRKLQQIQEFLPFSFVSNNQRELNFIANFPSAQIGNRLLEIGYGEDNLKVLNQLPPIFRTELFIKPKPESEVLADMKINNVQFKEPSIIVRNFQNQKSVAILGYGLYRWKLLGHSLREIISPGEIKIDAGSRLISNFLGWLSTTDESRKIRVWTNRKKYYSHEKIEIVGQVFDESFAPVDNAKIKVVISKQNEKQELLLPYIGGGMYSLQFGPLKEGDYNFSAEITLNNNKLAQTTGKFIVEKSNLEYLNMATNEKLLEYIAKSTYGKFYRWNQTEELAKDISYLQLKEQVSKKESRISIWENFTLLLLSILLFATEWFIRRTKGLL